MLSSPHHAEQDLFACKSARGCRRTLVSTAVVNRRATLPARFRMLVSGDSSPLLPLLALSMICGSRPPNAMIAMVDACKAAPCRKQMLSEICPKQTTSCTSSPPRAVIALVGACKSCTRHEALAKQQSQYNDHHVEPDYYCACSCILIFRSSNCIPASIPMDTASDNKAQQPKPTRMPDARILGPSCFLQSKSSAQISKACTYTHSRCVESHASSNASPQVHAEAAGYIARAEPACTSQ